MKTSMHTLLAVTAGALLAGASASGQDSRPPALPVPPPSQLLKFEESFVANLMQACVVEGKLANAARNRATTPEVRELGTSLGADYPKLAEICRREGLKLLSDSAQGFGCTLGGQHPLHWADATATSFFPAKPLGCYGDGGAVLTNDQALWDVMDSLRVHGKGEDKYDNVRIGMNARLDTIQAAVLSEKLTVFADEVEARNQVAAHYEGALEEVVTVPRIPAGTTSVWAQYTVRLPNGRDRDAVAARLKAFGVPTAVYYAKPLHGQSAYRHYPTAGNGLPVSDRLASEVLSLPMHPYLDEGTQDHIVAALRASLSD